MHVNENVICSCETQNIVADQLNNNTIGYLTYSLETVNFKFLSHLCDMCWMRH